MDRRPSTSQVSTATKMPGKSPIAKVTATVNTVSKNTGTHRKLRSRMRNMFAATASAQIMANFIMRRVRSLGTEAVYHKKRIVHIMRHEGEKPNRIPCRFCGTVSGLWRILHRTWTRARHRRRGTTINLTVLNNGTYIPTGPGNFSISFANFQNPIPQITGPTLSLRAGGTGEIRITGLPADASVNWLSQGDPITEGTNLAGGTASLALNSGIHGGGIGTHLVTGGSPHGRPIA